MEQHAIASKEQRDFVIRTLMDLDVSKAWLVTIKLQRPRRSINQNSLFHSWCHIIAVSTGNTDEDVKSALKDLFLPMKVVQVGRTERMVRAETSSLDVTDMGIFMDRIQAFAATELGISLPSPEVLSE